MFFEQWWQGLIFGAVTTVALLAIANAFTVMWKKYEDVDKKASSHGCNTHH